MADDLELLDWLQLKIFPYENAHNKNSLLTSVRLGINELLLSGTTTLLDMGTLRHQEVIFEELQSSGMRAIAGKCLIDKNDLYHLDRMYSTVYHRVEEQLYHHLSFYSYLFSNKMPIFRSLYEEWNILHQLLQVLNHL